MPKVILNPSAEKDEKLKKTILKQAIEKDMLIKDIAISTRISETTLRSRLKKPSAFTLSELRCVCKALSLTMNELLEADLL